MHGLTDRGDLGHQDGGGLQIPIGVRDVSVAEIGGERDDMACDGIGVVATLFKRANREGVAQVVDAGTSLATAHLATQRIAPDARRWPARCCS